MQALFVSILHYFNGRVILQWIFHFLAKIGFFYLIFYGFLAGFFSAMLAVFLTTVENPEEGGRPKLTQFIENQPGMNILIYFTYGKWKYPAIVFIIVYIF